MTKLQQIKLRKDSYKEPRIPERRCENCRFYWNYLSTPLGSCHAIEIRGQLEKHDCHPLGLCGLWKEKDAR